MQNLNQPSVNQIQGISETHVTLPSGTDNHIFWTIVKDMPSK